MSSSSPIFFAANHRVTRPVVLATLASTLSFISLPLIAQSTQNPQAAGPATASSTMQADTPGAGGFVPAQAILLHTLDAKKLQPGASIEAKLDGKVKLANGTELPGGTILRGTVATDDLNVQANSKLALRFSTAELKKGQTVPVQVAIVGFEPEGDLSTVDNAGDLKPQPNEWQLNERVIDQIGVTKGVDLHSRLGSQNSGVFVSTSKDNVKLSSGSAVNLAIAPAQSAGSVAGL